ncbi:serine/threonine-protein phosphatase [candidate division KSB1 bacterium]|nr:serine/threonine-protein phosphatase [candidate division KSB1 bacterium]NIR72043.1 serine/threonine-protein phosphatase [candidate division KSB1 bacterium]NIS25984.1 serine/threonine-protein phosphatase [candidate division KSB1 bacterium]NIT74955.1 serine/threonine-protein phosphatase [candidate division KSB1 bacterium]NIU28739.1 serine/threonine-protein phosphatase [candidate division KSB1 bacterium]
MTETRSASNREPNITKTLIADFKEFFRNIFGGDVKGSVSRSFKELREFYLDEGRRERLASMGRVKRWFLTGFWLLKAMILKLSPMRRVLLVIGIFLLLKANNNTEDSTNYAVLGGLILLLILMFELKDKLIARSELQAGHAVQEALLPPKRPDVPGWDVWLYYHAANEVGGDLLDFQKINGNRYGMALGDVADKGLKAALIMAKLQATLRALSPDYGSLTDLVAKINQISHRDGLPTSFASLVYLELPEKSGAVRFVNAGHMPPFVVTKDDVRELAKGDPALGLAPDTHYSEHSLELKKGELLVVYSDGVTEARNQANELFGEDGLFELLNRLGEISSPEIGERIVAEVARFVGEAPRTDDLSLAIMRHV